MAPVAAQHAMLNVICREPHPAHVVGDPAKESNVTQHRAADFVMENAVKDECVVKIDPKSDLMGPIPKVFFGAIGKGPREGFETRVGFAFHQLAVVHLARLR